MKNLLIVLLLFFSFNAVSKEKKDNLKPLKVNKKVEKKVIMLLLGQKLFSQNLSGNYLKTKPRKINLYLKKEINR